MNALRRMIRSERGYTLLEVLIGFVLFMAVLFPSILLLVRFTGDATTTNQLVALEMLRGELSVFKNTGQLPPSRTPHELNSGTYSVRCDTTSHDSVVQWKISVFRNQDSLASIAGLAPGSPMDKPRQKGPWNAQ